MSRWGRSSVILAVALWPIVPAGAWAGDVTCAWNILTDAQQNALVARAGGDATAPSFHWELAQAQRVVADCHYDLSDRASKAVTPAVVSHAMELAGASQLSREFGVSSSQANAAWDGLTPAERSEFTTFLELPVPDFAYAAPEQMRLFLKLMKELGLSDRQPGAVNALFNFLAGRTGRERYEAVF